MPLITIPDDLYAQMPPQVEPAADETFYTLKGLPTVEEFRHWHATAEIPEQSSYLMLWLRISLAKGTEKYKILEQIGYYS